MQKKVLIFSVLLALFGNLTMVETTSLSNSLLPENSLLADGADPVDPPLPPPKPIKAPIPGGKA